MQAITPPTSPPTPPTLEVIAHVWNYDRLATLFLSQLCLHPPAAHTTVTICYSDEDQRTVAVLYRFHWQMANIPSLTLNPRPLETSRLFRRAIGRDECGRASRADFVLFADIDYLLGPGAVDAIVEGMTEVCRDIDGNPAPKLCFPRVAGWSTQEAGDAIIAAVDSPRVIGVPGDIFTPTRMGRAIGGCQWLPGDAVRSLGYLPPGHRFLRPANAWRRTFDDTAARRHWVRSGLSICPISVPNVWRIRHSKRGRFDVGVRL